MVDECRRLRGARDWRLKGLSSGMLRTAFWYVRMGSANKPYADATREIKKALIKGNIHNTAQSSSNQSIPFLDLREM